MRLKFKVVSKASLLFILACVSLFLPYIFLRGTVLLKNGNYLLFIWVELLFLATICILWYKIYYEIIVAKIENGVLFYKHLFFIKKSIKKEDLKGFKIGNEDSDFLVLYDGKDKKMFFIRTDFYTNYYDFIDELKIENLGVYYTRSQRFIRKIFNKRD